MAGDHCGGLRVGHWVLTGSLHPIAPVNPGTTFSARIDGLGEVTLRLCAR
jgi:2-keto-4-pentenoate hydratase